MIRKKLILLIERGLEEGVEPPLQDFVTLWKSLDQIGRSQAEGVLRMALDDYADEIGENEPGTDTLQEAVQYFTVTGTFCCATGISDLVESFQEALRRVLISSEERSLEVAIPNPMDIVRHYTH